MLFIKIIINSSLNVLPLIAYFSYIKLIYFQYILAVISLSTIPKGLVCNTKVLH